jgi:hypothetical protein
MAESDTDPLVRYWNRAKDDPLRISILAAHALIEELIENVIAEAVPNCECFDVPKMGFRQKLNIIKAASQDFQEMDPQPYARLWKCIQKLTDLRNAAAHGNYEELREQRFNDFAEFFYPDPKTRTAKDRETLLAESTDICAGCLLLMQRRFRDSDLRSRKFKVPTGTQYPNNLTEVA